MSRISFFLVAFAVFACSLFPLPASARPDRLLGFVQLIHDPASLLNASVQANTARMKTDYSLVNTAGISLLWSQTSWNSSDMYPSSMTPSMSQLRSHARFLRSLNLSIVLKPAVLPLHSSTFNIIQPANLTSWFANYRAFLFQYVEFAVEESIEILCIGLEYANLTSNPHITPYSIPLFLELIADIREVYRGQLTYSALPNEWYNIPPVFWSQLDFIGIDAYIPLATPAQPQFNVTYITQRWVFIFHKLQSWQRQSNLTHIPIVFLEFGYPSYQQALITPWVLPSNTEQCIKQSDTNVQAQIYDYFLQFFISNSIVSLQSYWSLLSGLLFFEWSLPGIDYETDPQYPCGWNPREKPAEKVLMKYFN